MQTTSSQRFPATSKRCLLFYRMPASRGLKYICMKSFVKTQFREFNLRNDLPLRRIHQTSRGTFISTPVLPKKVWMRIANWCVLCWGFTSESNPWTFPWFKSQHSGYVSKSAFLWPVGTVWMITLYEFHCHHGGVMHLIHRNTHRRQP